MIHLEMKRLNRKKSSKRNKSLKKNKNQNSK